MTKRPTLFATVHLTYERSNREYEASVEVEFTSDGEDIIITAWKTWDAHPAHIDTAWFDELVYDAVCDIADETYAEWLDDQADYLEGCRAAESYIPMGRAA